MTNKQHIEDLIEYRLKRAMETIEDAKLLAKVDHWNPCVNRLYYACFYAVTALLIQHGLSSSKHTGIRSMFNREFVKQKKSPKRWPYYTTIYLKKVRKGKSQ